MASPRTLTITTSLPGGNSFHASGEEAQVLALYTAWQVKMRALGL